MAPKDNKLAELSRDLERLAGRLSALAREGAHDPPSVTPALVRLVLALRLMGSDHFPSGLGEPARNMLLALFAARLEGKTPTLTELAAASAVPRTTALRWLGIMGERGLIARTSDPNDRRLVRLAPTPTAVAGIEAYLAAIFQRPFLLP